ncbi:GNAT family N-acetyltransferase [Pseudochryseolinea flava]|uniref:GNAT family N-acetyltransferase n=1 Tax=Pseudochryseolinea flava TaxID=2059302 RepID=A0A364Y8R1_9BACT|nr:GNAT family N-acetyltransferase [Pseudochryseolinea flava]RAW03330.1 GNAT family N-acetyltransferase [Pseudochryseolinea flava]
MNQPIVRQGRIEDLPSVLALIKELAEYERALDQVINTLPQLETDGFGPEPVFGFFVAEQDHVIQGIALYYWRYSTWTGKRLYLEDIVVTERARGRGLGKLLFDRTMQHALDKNCSGMMWQVLDWNEPAINFYKKYGTKMSQEWVNCTLERAQIIDYLSKT